MLKKMIFIISIIFATMMVISTGAYTNIDAHRLTSINVSDDSNSLIGFTPTSDYAYFENGKLTIDFDSIAANGVNPDSLTSISDVFSIKNNSGDSVFLSILKEGNHPSAISFGTIEDGVQLLPGDSLSVSMDINSSGLDSISGIINSFSITATK